MASFEVWLPVGAIGLYLFDSIGWLYSNELMILRRGRTWRCAQTPGLLLGGRRVYFPNPLTPGTPEFKVRWSESDSRQEQESDTELEQFFRALRPVTYLVNTLLVLLLALPGVLFVYGTDVELLVLLVAFYGTILAGLGYIYGRRRQLRLTGRAFAMLCFDSLACAPFAVNLVRKLSLRRSLVGNPIAFAALSFAPAELGRLIDAVADRVAQELLQEEGPTGRREELEAYRQRLLALGTSQPRPSDG